MKPLFATRFARNIRPHVNAELEASRAAQRAGRSVEAFARLERAHVLGQASTVQHVRVHLAMLRWGVQQRDARECLGQLTRIIGAATKTAFGWVPAGNTGGARVGPLRPMRVPDELRTLIERAKTGT